MPRITVTADTFFVKDTATFGRPEYHVRGRARITQQGDELCRVAFTLKEFAAERVTSLFPSRYEGTIELSGGIPLDVGLPDLVMELSDGRKVAIEVTRVKRIGLRETWGFRALRPARM